MVRSLESNLWPPTLQSSARLTELIRPQLKNLKISSRKSLPLAVVMHALCPFERKWSCIIINYHLCHMFGKFLEICLMWLCLHFSVSDKTVSESKPAVENKGNATVLYFLCEFIVPYTTLKLIVSMKSLISWVLSL